MTKDRLMIIFRNFLCSFLLGLSFSSCGTHKVTTNIREIAIAAIRLDMDIALEDNHKLYIEASKWIGTPYRSGGNSKKGVDCSGLTSAIYKSVYRKRLERKAEDQREKDCRRILKRNLKEGDLVFFHDGRRKREASHVGIYLKEGRFIHASSSLGVTVSKLSERYYDKHWLSAGRVK